MGLRVETRAEADRRRWAEQDAREAARRAELGVGSPPEILAEGSQSSRKIELQPYAHKGGFELAWGGTP